MQGRLSVCIRQISILFLLLGSAACAETYQIDSKEAYEEIAAKLSAGDTVILKNGVWTDFEILLSGKGTENKPITLMAETSGKVILSGQSNLRLAGEYLVAKGLVFKDGHTPSSVVIEFRRNEDDLAYHSRVTEMVIDDYNNPDKTEPDYWVAMYGQHNRFDHNHLVNKRNKGVTVAVRLDSENSQQNNHRIDHNYFGYRPIFGSNGGETLRIGTSHYSLTDSLTVVENNYFDRTNGEVEVVSVKSGKNTVRGNVFYEARGTLTIRHGNGNVLENNVFFGNGKKHTGGIRVINEDQLIRNNYMEGLTGYRFGSGFTIMNGVPNSPINRYHQVKNATIINNSFIDLDHIQLAAGSDAERSAVPINSKITNSLIINTNNQNPFTLFDDVSGIEFSNNLSNTEAPEAIAYGIDIQDIELSRNSNGLLISNVSSKGIGANPELSVIDKSDTGVNWYPKLPPEVDFDSGKTIPVAADASALMSAIAIAEDGDILELQPGQYDVPKLITINKTISLKGTSADDVKITFERSALFEIHDGGNLLIDSVHISGENSPDYSGNNVIRSKKWGMLNNYRFHMSNSYVTDLDVNHSFHFFQTGKVAFADEITLINNRFNNISGDILKLDAELEDLGVYNAEYVTLTNNHFEDIEGGIARIYRGGSDESTFGPQLIMERNTLKNVGLGNRNKSMSSLFLHGVQVTNVDQNSVLNSAPISIEHTVGEPITRIQNNRFTETPAPLVKELRVAGPHTAIIVNNEMK